MFPWNLAFAWTFVVFVMFVGEAVSTKTRGIFPQMLFVSFVFLVGFWTFLPDDIIDLSGLSIAAEICKLIILVSVGAMFDIKSLIKDWRVVVTTLAAIAGLLVMVLTIGTLIFGKEIVIMSAAPLAGGGMAAVVMNSAAQAMGRPDLGMLAFMVFILQGFVGFPLTSFFLRKEGRRLVAGYRSNPAVYADRLTEASAQASASGKPALWERVPERYRTTTFYLATLFILVAICQVIYTLLNGVLDSSIISIVVGVAAGTLGLIPRDAMNRTESSGFLTLALFASFMSSLATATVELVIQLVIIIAVLLALSSVGIVVLSVLIGKRVGYSTYMAIAIGLNCFLGFPYNYNLTIEAVRIVAKTPEESAYLTSEMLPKMIIGSVVAVSVVSTILAGVFVNFL